MTQPIKLYATSLFFAAALLSLNVVEVRAETDTPLTVVELFTSQGCSSCPPADTYLGELSQNKNVLALSYHVDYWDNLGWKDPYSSAQNTRRQRTYASHMDLRYIYTPQMVVQGTQQGTGSDRNTIAQQIKAAGKMPSLNVHLKRNGEKLQLLLAKAPQPLNADIYMVIYDKQHVTKIKRGENSGKTVTNRNVVRAIKNIGSWTGEQVNLSLPLADDADNGDACAVIIQSRANGAILGAATIAIN